MRESRCQAFFTALDTSYKNDAPPGTNPPKIAAPYRRFCAEIPTPQTRTTLFSAVGNRPIRRIVPVQALREGNSPSPAQPAEQRQRQVRLGQAAQRRQQVEAEHRQRPAEQ